MNANRIAEGKETTAFDYNLNNALREKSASGSNSSSDKNSETSAVGNTRIGGKKKNKMLEFTESGAISNLGVK